MTLPGKDVVIFDVDKTLFKNNVSGTWDWENAVDRHPYELAGKKLDLYDSLAVCTERLTSSPARQEAFDDARKQLEKEGSLTYNDKVLEDLVTSLKSGKKVALATMGKAGDIVYDMVRTKLEEQGVSKEILDDKFIVVCGKPDGPERKDEHIAAVCRHYDVVKGEEQQCRFVEDDWKNQLRAWSHGVQVDGVDSSGQPTPNKLNITPTPFSSFGCKQVQIEVNEQGNIEIDLKMLREEKFVQQNLMRELENLDTKLGSKLVSDLKTALASSEEKMVISPPDPQGKKLALMREQPLKSPPEMMQFAAPVFDLPSNADLEMMFRSDGSSMGSISPPPPPLADAVASAKSQVQGVMIHSTRDSKPPSAARPRMSKDEPPSAALG